MKNHPNADVLADLMSGEIETETLQKILLPHLLECCPQCRRTEQQIQEHLRELDHWNASIALGEGREAPVLLEQLLALPGHPDRLLRISKDETLHTWGLAAALLDRCQETVLENASRAVEFGELAALVVENLPPAGYQEDWLADLQIRVLAHLGNAKRVLGEHKSAEADFHRASLLLLHKGTGRPTITAELQYLTASLRLAQRRFAEALALLERAASEYDRRGDRHRVGRCLITRAKVLAESGQEDTAFDLLRRVPAMLDADREPRLLVYVHHNLLCCLLFQERFKEAEELLPVVQEEFQTRATEVDHLRLEWIEGRIALGLGDLEKAERVFRKLQEDFLARELALEAAVVSLDLAVLLTENERTEELEQLVQAILPLFESQDLHQEALATLRLLRGAIRHRALSPELARQLLLEVREGCAARA